MSQVLPSTIHGERITGGNGRTQGQALRLIQDRISEEAKCLLGAPITILELKKAMEEMANGKSPGPDGIILEFYNIYWEIIRMDYWQMTTKSIISGQLPLGVTQGMIALLHKGGDRTTLTNWRPITLLNIGYKIYAKALQLRLQPILMEVISPDQSAFLPLATFYIGQPTSNARNYGVGGAIKPTTRFPQVGLFEGVGYGGMGFLIPSNEDNGISTRIYIYGKIIISKR